VVINALGRVAERFADQVVGLVQIESLVRLTMIGSSLEAAAMATAAPPSDPAEVVAG
jgi:hypothetical protein